MTMKKKDLIYDHSQDSVVKALGFEKETGAELVLLFTEQCEEVAKVLNPDTPDTLLKQSGALEGALKAAFLKCGKSLPPSKEDTILLFMGYICGKISNS